ncbi:MAG: hypothetical protein P1P84_10485 [Deferrisomatales bacterium]|nr:hypothetical protein [Deferrisomatales bacterium]
MIQPCPPVRVLIALLALLPTLGWGATASIREMAQQGDRVTVRYDLAAAGPMTVRLVGSSDGGHTFAMRLRSVSGDVGTGVAPGPGKVIHWDTRGDYPEGIEHLDVVLDLVVEARAPDAPTYVVIPLHGKVGKEIRASVLGRCLAAALAQRPSAVVLEVDSPGGFLSELYQLLNLSLTWQREHPEQRVVVLVREQAMSAAAVLSTSVPEIYLLPGSAIGAAMAIHIDRNKVTAVQEKFSSAYRGKARAAAEAGGHDPLLVEAMIDPDLEVSASDGADGAVQLVKGAPPEGGRRLIGEGKLLTLTADEAVAVGLAAGVVNDYAELGGRLGHPEWREGSDAARQIVAAWKEEIQGVETDYHYLVETIKDGLSRLRQSSGTDYSAIEGNLWEVRDAVDELEQIAEDYPFMGPAVHNTFDIGTGEIKQQFDKAIGELKRYRVQRSRARRN